ncbi:MAG: hypothetical protein H6574_21825 [Lewinellaceae bacterium]|nr:hypothetical protein [Saprospiraceae bacterium]MCB9317425.1 hypothetical protein [Lewinellaceae bacterium]MCB9333703.1 hypothetical protein [Lewinellaceae bacterium]
MDKSNWIGLGVAAAVLLFVFFNADGEKNTVVDDLMQSTMAIHDEAMKEMAGMNRYGRMLKSEITGLDSLSGRADSIRTVLRQIKLAEEGMYTWMSEYKAPTKLSEDAASAYLEDQKQKISKNQQDIQAATQAARLLIER